ncbi:serine/threonine-protein kinase SMG1 [Onthophagus taurus]|uniref:serine/threonine-protein kinase SMG1 n=1 Tax=Onthophagus taurus TaxID=166361 RepID=UPI0039BE3DA6
MISNSSQSYKLKTSKSSSFQDNNHQVDDVVEDESVDGDAAPSGDANRRYQVYNNGRDGRYRGIKTRQNNNRSTERRNFIRGGRGGSTPSRRGERDYNEGVYIIGRKYQDALNRNSGTYHPSKYYENDKKEIKFNLPEDTRISKLLRRLNIEEDPDNSLVISKKLLEVLLIPDNSIYVKKAFHILCESMLDILRVAPGPTAKCQAARALGRMGYIMGQEIDFERFQTWLFSKIPTNSDNLTYLFMKAFLETLSLEKKKPVLQKHSASLMKKIVSTIENTDNIDVFKTGLEVLVNLVELYPDDFYPLFRDTTDIVIGWHVDHTQLLSNIEFISKSMQKFSKYFQLNIDFSVTLLLHFMEDIETYSNQLKIEKDSDTISAIDHLTVFVLALNTVLKSLGQDVFNPKNENITTKFVTDCLEKIVATLIKALTPATFSLDNLTIAGNESIGLLLSVNYTKPIHLCNSILTLVDLELSMINEFSDATIISVMLMISKVIKELSASLPVELIPKLLGPESEIVKLRRSSCENILEAIVSVYQSLLNMKNIPLLQEAYRYILGDLELVYKYFVPISPLCSNNPFMEVSCSIGEAENMILFLFKCLSQLANVSGSIIGMWALRPSILELLGVLLEPYNENLSKSNPILQYSLLYLLFSHCRCYNYFISNSSLVTDKFNIIGHLGLPETFTIDDVGKSPNSGHFPIVLNVLYKTLLTKPCTETILLLLNWFEDVLIYAEPYLEVFYDTNEFRQLVEITLKSGYSKIDNVILTVCKNLDKLLSNKRLAFPNAFLTNINELCVLHMTSNNPEVRQNYTKLSVNIPWDIAVKEFGKLYTIDKAKQIYGNSISRYNVYTCVLAQHLHVYGSMYGEMLPFQLKSFMNYLLKNEMSSEKWLEDIFIICWYIDAENQISPYTTQFYDLALKSKSVLQSWATWEAAQFCVNTKLRTPLGKPNETFTSFEISLKNTLKDLVKVKENADYEVIPGAVDESKIYQVRLLLQFMDHLEISIYNAYEGSAIAIPQPTKPVRTFFNTNSSTCKEWLSRIRPTIIQLGLHAGQSAFVYRHCQILIKDLVDGNQIETPEFEQTVMLTALSLLNMHESDCLQGLYVFCKKNGKEINWIKACVDQASQRYELAVDGYKKSINKELPNFIKQFIYDQIIFCLKQINNWYDIVMWQDEAENYLGEDYQCPKHSYSTWSRDCFISLFEMETGNVLTELSSWEESPTWKTWSCQDVLCQSEMAVYNTAFNILRGDKETTLNILDLNLNKIHWVMQAELLALPSEYLQNYCLLNYITHGLKNIVNNSPVSNVLLVSENFEHEIDNVDSCVLSKILWWSEYFAKIQNQGFSLFCSNLRLNVIKRARKEKNYNLAVRHLYHFLQEKDMVSPIENSGSILIDITNSLIKKIPDFTMWSLDTAKAVQEMIKLLYVNSEHRPLTFNLCAISSTSISKCADRFGGSELKYISSKILMKLANWLQVNEQVSITELDSPLGKFLTVLPEIGTAEYMNIIPLTEMAIGKLLQFSVQQCNQTLAKSWNAYGTWCYRWGRKVVDSTSTELSNILTEEDQTKIQQVLPPDSKPDDLRRIYLILSQVRVFIDEEDIDSNEINTSEMIKSQLQNVPVLSNASENEIQSLVQIWRTIHKRVFEYYELSAEAYFKYLHLTTNNEYFTQSTESNIVTVTLRLLRLIVKHALELQDVLEEGLRSTPTQPWKIIIPQLFSRLNHPENYVRQRVSELLCRIAEDAPHLIMFPAVVGALEGGVKFDFSEISLPKDCLSQNNENNDDTEDEIEDSYDSENDDSKNVLQSCFKSMVDTLSKQAPETINEVQVLVKELRRIILLWDELWLGTLAQHHGEINKRQQQLEVEIDKVHANPHLSYEEKSSLITEKHRIIIKPIIFILEQLNDITSREPETPHEKQFQEQYSQLIIDTLAKLKNPGNSDKPQESWALLKDLQTKFQQKAHKRTSYSLKMTEISPVLAGMKNTMIAMPGLVSTKHKINISHVSNHVSILPTKTKPKKLVFHGSDGHTYTYLFKGLEDLHLDERIMQFLSITNTMMAQNKDGLEQKLYNARYYSVIPLGPRSGLISWVDGTTPVFALYKRWQQRESAKSSKSSSSSTSVLRPSELFYNKLNPLLQEHGVKNVDNRKEWPLVVLKKVLTELMNETPSDLLAKELWCHSVNAAAWWHMVRKYSYSVAVMSIIGYIIGLGDRHLDNVLVDLTSGDVVHIDYNVCFEKGKALRVPEKVPFRLTPNIRDALGVTGVEGIFRMACENVLRTMKKGRETLLTLLEAFVYDPLIDWTLGVEGLAGTIFGGVPGSATSRQTRKDLEREVTLAMYNVRCTEVKIDWNKNRDDILNNLPILDELLTKWLNESKTCSQVQELLQDLHQQMALVKEAEANGISKHSLYSLPNRYNKYKQAQDSIANAKKDLDSLIKDCGAKGQRYTEALLILEGQQFPQWLMELNASFEAEHQWAFDIVKDFLQNAGQSTMLAQCEQSEKDIDQLSKQQILLTIKCLQSLQEYTAIIQQCPPNFLKRHRINAFARWCRYLQETTNLTGCDIVYTEFVQFIEQNNDTTVKNALKFAYQLNVLSTETASQLAKALDDFTKIHTEPGVLDRMYNDAKLGVLNFLRQEKYAAKAFEFVIISELLLLNQHFLGIERAASRRGDWLLKLSAADNVWLLEDLTYQSDKAMELLSYLFLCTNNAADKLEDPTFKHIYNVLTCCNCMYKGLQELYFNFHTIILPESMKKIQCCDVSVLEIINELNSLIHGVGMSLPDIVAHLENNLKCTVMEMDISSSGDYVLEKIKELKLNFEALVHSSQEYTLNLGKMLLMGFNGLFQKVNVEYNNLMEVLCTLEVPLAWKKIDHVKDAKSLAAPTLNPSVKTILEDIFLIKRIQAIADFFNICVEMCQGFKGTGQSVVFNDEQIIKPVRKYIADFIGRQFLGVTTEVLAYSICSLLQTLGLDVTNEIEQKDIGAENKVPLDELSHKGWGSFVKHGTFTQNVLAQASSLETNMRTAWERMQEPKKYDRNLNLLQSSLKRLQNQVMMTNWMFEDLLNQHNWYQNGSIINRSKFILDLKNESSALTTVQLKLSEAQELQKPLINSVEQRLKWASGANPDLNEKLSKFELALSAYEEKLKSEHQITNIVLTTCRTILQHEMLRSHTAETKAFDQLFLTTCEKWRVVCQFNSMKVENVSEIEENIMKLYTPNLEGNPKWLNVISEKISDIITGTQSELEDLKSNKLVIISDIISNIDKTKPYYSEHCKLMTDFKSLIKSMAKIEEYASEAQLFIIDYRKYIDHFSNIFTRTRSEISREDIEAVRSSVYYLKDHTATIYEKLLNLEQQENGGRVEQLRETRRDSQSKNVKQENTRGQQRNAYAVSVWRRVRQKLEGKDPDVGRKYTIQEQVEHVIREATSLDNLALLYEGWTPWV